MADAFRVAVVGGGITGLAAAHTALSHGRERGREVAVTVLEGSKRLGGNLVTERVDGFVLDGGPDSWVANKPHASALATELGLRDSLIGTNEGARRYYVAWGGRLHAVPEDIVLGVPVKISALAWTKLFSWRGKARMALEPFVSVRHGEADESIADFATRRLGHEAAERLVAPLLGGISAGDASELSVRAAFPQLVAMERDYGSLVRAMRAARRAREAAASKGAGTSAFVSLAGGIGDLVTALADRLRGSGAVLRTEAGVRSLARADGAWRIEVDGAEPVVADAVLLAIPAYAASRVLGGLDGSVADRLASLRSASTATVFLGFRRSDVTHPLDGSGFVVPRTAGRPILASTWVSSKWRARAPEGHVLVRAFFGGSSGDGSGARVLDEDDAELIRRARAELGSLMGLAAEPVLSRVFRFDRASPQMRVGHGQAMREIHARLEDRAATLRLAGGGYDGIGIPDCIRQGQDAARALVEGALVRP